MEKVRYLWKSNIWFFSMRIIGECFEIMVFVILENIGIFERVVFIYVFFFM